jgi:hypothetical protein
MLAASQPAQRGDPLVPYLKFGKRLCQRIIVELRVLPRSRQLPDVDYDLDLPDAQEIDELGYAAGGVADGVKWKRHSSMVVRVRAIGCREESA